MISFASEHRRDREDREKRRDKESHVSHKIVAIYKQDIKLII